jgi:hypothetical protein
VLMFTHQGHWLYHMRDLQYSSGLHGPEDLESPNTAFASFSSNSPPNHVKIDVDDRPFDLSIIDLYQ